MANERDPNWKGYTAIETWASGSRRFWQFVKSRFLFFLVLAAIIYLLFVGYFYFTSDAGQRRLQQIGDVVRNYNPITLFVRQVEKAQQIGNIWSAESNLSQIRQGIIFKDFQVIGTAEVPQGNPVIAAYKVDIEGVSLESTKISFFCNVDASISVASISVLPNTLGDSLVPALLPSIVPKQEVEVAGKSFRENVRCVLPPEATQSMEGTYNLKGKLSFTGETKNVRLNVYFSTAERLEAENIDYGDFFSALDIDESLPIRATYNGEPVEIGIGVSTENEQPVLVGDSLIGITLTNKWDGVVKRIESLEFSLPEGVSVDTETSRNPNSVCPFTSMGSSRGRNDYEIAETFKDVEIKKGLSRTFECFLKVDQSVVSPEEVYTKKAYVVSSSYLYESEEKSVPFTVKSTPVVGGTGAS